IIIIYSKFLNLNSDKQKEIINAAIMEFAQSGFEKASTNEIVRKANISKGSLFNYFNSKIDLYLYLIDYSVQIIEQIVEQIDLIVYTKQKESAEVKEIIKQKVEPIYDESTNKMYEQIDYDKFREGIDIEKAIEILNWTMFGFGEKGLKQINTFENINEFGEHY